MTFEINESLGFEANPTSGKKWSAKIIESGWGSSGYYPADMLRTYGPVVFKKGTKVFMNHPSVSEAHDRPERDVNNLIGRLSSDAVFNEADGSLRSTIEFYSHVAPVIREMWEDVGLSIHAYGEAKVGEAEGREGPIIERLVADPLTSVDVVTVAGAGGKFLSLLESYAKKDEAATMLSESVSEGNPSMITKEEFEAAIADLKATFVETMTPISEQFTALMESASADVVEEDAVEEEAQVEEPAAEEAVADEAVAEEPAAEGTEEAPEVVAESIDPVTVAVKFNESGLPAPALARVAEAMKADPSKTVDELIEAERAYVEAVSVASSTISSGAFGTVEEAKSINPADELNAIVSRIAGK